MRDLLLELVEPLLVCFYGAIVAVLTAIGIGAELIGLAGVSGGLDVMSVWFVYLGAVGLAAAAVVAKRRFLPTLARST